MKLNFLLTAALIAITAASKAQTRSVGDTIEIELISFESTNTYIQQGTPTTNIWQVGKPQKLTFTQAYSEPNAMVTDTLNVYPANNHSWFDVVLPKNLVMSYMSIGIRFQHKYNTDTLKDGGYISVSYDKGKSFINLLDDNESHGSIGQPFPFNYEDNFYSMADTLFNGEKGFSGTIKDWQQISFDWFVLMVKNDDFNLDDTLIVRFNFISDATESARDGWMIDDLTIISVDHGGNVHEMPLQSNLEVFPNPIVDAATIKSKDGKLIEAIKIFNANGQLVDSYYPKSSSYKLEKLNLEKGIYFIQCEFTDQKKESIKIMIH